MGSLVGRTCSKAVDPTDEAGLAEQETKDSKLAINYCGGCHSRGNSQSHMRVHWKVGLERSKRAALFPLWPLPHRQH